MRRTRRLRGLSILTILVTGLGAPAAGRAGDWPRFRGPEGSGIAEEAGLARSWPEGGPEIAWRRPLGEGFAAISVVGDGLYTLYADGEDEYAARFRVADGEETWRRRIGGKFVDHWGNGPRSTPVADGGVVYALASEGGLFALSGEGGEVVWQLDLVAELGHPNRPTLFDAGVQSGDVPLGPYWGYCSSPLIEDDLLIVYTGAGEGHSLVALDKATGETRWSRFDHLISYSSPFAVTLGGRRQIVVAMAREIVSVSPGGEELWRHPWARYNVSQPVFLPPDKLFFSSANDVGAVLLKVRGAGAGFEVEEVWREERMRNSWQSSVAHRDSIVGFDNATLKLLSATGETLWARRGLGKGTLALADGLLFVLGDRGVLTLAEWSAESFRETGRADILDGKSLTAPTVAQGKLFARNHQEMVCVDLTAETEISGGR